MFRFFVTLFSLFLFNQGKLEKCDNGHNPLLDEINQYYSCERGCPDTFYCDLSISMCCPNVTDILNRVESSISSQIDESSEISTLLSCQRYPYRLNCTDSSSQSQAKWYFNIQTLSCELYPLGICKNDPIIKIALKTKEECEQRCDVQNVKNSINGMIYEEEWENDDSLLTDSEDNIPAEDSKTIIKLAKFKKLELSNFPNIDGLAIDDPLTESKHIRSRPIAIEPPTDLQHSIHIISDSNFGSITKNPENEYSAATVTSSIINVFQKGTVRKIEELEGSGIDQEDQNNPQLNSNSLGKEYIENVVCTKSIYKLICKNGLPTQFVYRWEYSNGKCQSFPYGYCWRESNLAHPRTKEECEILCK